MAKKYKYSYYVFDSKEDYDLFLELIEEIIKNKAKETITED